MLPHTIEKITEKLENLTEDKSYETKQKISELVKNSGVVDRVKRDGGYGHQCSNPFAIFPFLIFLQSMATTVVNVININNNNNNNNNNNKYAIFYCNGM